MAKQKRILTAAEKAARKQRKKDYMTIFINGKQKRVKREPTVDGLPVEEFITQNADPIWLHQHGEWQYLEHDQQDAPGCQSDWGDQDIPRSGDGKWDSEIPATIGQENENGKA